MIFRVYTLCSLLLAANIRCFLPTSPSWSYSEYSPSLLLVCACNTEVYTTKQNVALVAGRLAECHWDNMESSSTAAPIMRTLSIMLFFFSINLSIQFHGFLRTESPRLDVTSAVAFVRTGTVAAAVSMAFSSGAFHLLRSRENLLIWFTEYRRRAALDSFLLALSDFSVYSSREGGSEYVAGSIDI